MNRRGFFGLMAGSMLAAASVTRLGQVTLAWAKKPAALMALATQSGHELGRRLLEQDYTTGTLRAIFPIGTASGHIGRIIAFDADGGCLGSLAEDHGFKTDMQTWQVTVEEKNLS